MIDPASTTLADGRVLLFGGWVDVKEPAITAETYDPNSGAWTAVEPTDVDAYESSRATRLQDGRVLVTEPPEVFLYDPATGRLASAAPMPEDGGYYTATLLVDGKVLLAGGQSAGSGPANPPYLASAQYYDPLTGKFVPTGSMKTGRENASAVRLNDGRVLVAGGDRGLCGECDQVVILSSAEIYDPATGKFSTTGSMHVARSNFAATLLADGRVLVTGGFPTGPAAKSSTGQVLNPADPQAESATAEIYDPANGTFTPCGQMTLARSEHRAFLLATGKVLIAGGDSDNTAELFDPASCTSKSLGQIPWGAGAAAVQLADGRVLFAGVPSGIYWP